MDSFIFIAGMLLVRLIKVNLKEDIDLERVNSYLTNSLA
jgi:hypothetical protein